MPEPVIPRYIPMGKACKIMSLNRKTVYKMLEDGHLNGEKTPGGHWRVDTHSISEYFNGKQKVVDLLRSAGL